MQINLILPAGDPGTYDDLIDEALVGVMLADNLNIAPLGSRELDSDLTETIWNDQETGRGRVRLMNDARMPAQWVSIEADDAAAFTSIADALRAMLPVQSYEALLKIASSWEPGALSRLALTYDGRLAKDLPPLINRALDSADVGQREDAAMAAHLSGLRATADVLRAALERETDAGVEAMLKHAIRTVELPGAKPPAT